MKIRINTRAAWLQLALVMPMALMLIIAAPPTAQAEPKAEPEKIEWQSWNEKLFVKAARQQRFVLLDLEAVWCHWCHVMEEKTYSNPAVKKLLAEKYITVKVDQDANPDLSNRYGDWGWPATIIFAADGTEIVKLRGYIPPERMANLLQAVIDDPSPGPSVQKELEVKPAAKSFLSQSQSKRLLGNYRAVYDAANGGWGEVHKFIHTENMDYALYKAANGDKEEKARAIKTLDAALHLFDPVWGGVYQYSDQVNWRSPHYEKIMWYQAHYMRHYAQAYTLWQKPEYLKAAKNIHRYLRTFLQSPEGAFYTSQNADLNQQFDGKTFYALGDRARREHGIPRIDKNIYARENGWAISGLIALYNAVNDPELLSQAIKAMNWVINNRRIGTTGGYRHGDKDRSGPFLGDTLAMGEAALNLYTATGERRWLKHSMKAADFIGKTFRHAGAGFNTSAKTASDVGVFKKPVRQIEENIQLGRYLNLLARYSGKKRFRDLSEHSMRYLASEEITGLRRFLIGIVLLDEELAIEPAHVTILGEKGNETAGKLHAAARRLPFIYRRIDWWDKREGPMINPDIEYPEMDQPAAFACANNICSLPVFEPKGLAPQVRKMMALRTEQPHKRQ